MENMLLECLLNCDYGFFNDIRKRLTAGRYAQKQRKHLYNQKNPYVLNYVRILRQVRHGLNMRVGGIVNKFTLLSILKPYFWWRKSHSFVNMCRSNGIFSFLYVSPYFAQLFFRLSGI